MNSNNATATNKKISELYSAIKSGNLVLQPAFQRKFVWNLKHQKTFIDTVLKQLPFPEIYIADTGINLDQISSQEVVVDGQQRLNTLVKYIDGNLAINNRDTIKQFKELTKTEQTKFLSYKVVVRQLEDVDADTIREIFRRINLTRYALNAYEIQHAIYDGEYIGLAKGISKSKEFNTIPAFGDSESSRMQDLGFILLVMTTLENQGYFSGDTEIEKFIKKYDSDFPNKKATENLLIDTIKIIIKLKLKPDSTWYRKSNLFTLFVEIALSSDLPNLVSLSDKLVQFEKKLSQNKDADKTKNDYSKYYSYMYTGTNSRQARVERSIIFKKYIL